MLVVAYVTRCFCDSASNKVKNINAVAMFNFIFLLEENLFFDSSRNMCYVYFWILRSLNLI